MNIRRKCFAAILALVIFLSAAGSVAADTYSDSADYVRQIVNYYHYYQEDAKTDIDCLIYALSENDPKLAQAWASIIEYWNYVNTDMQFYPDVLPDGLPQDDSLCIVVLGYALSNDGSMKKELVGRLETALRSAEKYPNAYIACSGGGTAQHNKLVTEAGQMAKWLIANGISEDRIIVEDESFSTVGNAINTCNILAWSYPQVTHLALVTSDYHLPRACLLFHTQATLAAYENNAPLLCVAANASNPTSRNAESFDLQFEDLTQLTKVSISGSRKPKLSTLDCILVSGSAQCVSGSELNVQVIAYYDTGLYRDVTKHVKYSGIDLASVGIQDVTITYEENGVSVSSVVQIEMLPPETEPPTEPPTEAATEPPTEPPATEAVQESGEGAPRIHWLVLPSVAIAVLVIAEILIITRLRKIKKLQKAAKEEKEADKLPDDDSPLEYV